MAHQLLEHKLILAQKPNEHKLQKKLRNIVQEMQDAKSKTIHREILTLTQQLIQVPSPEVVKAKKKKSLRGKPKKDTTWWFSSLLLLLIVFMSQTELYPVRSSSDMNLTVSYVLYYYLV